MIFLICQTIRFLQDSLESHQDQHIQPNKSFDQKEKIYIKKDTTTNIFAS